MHEFFMKIWKSSVASTLCVGRGGAGRGGRARAGRGRYTSRQSVAGRRAARTRYARPVAYYVPPRPPASLHGGRRSDLFASALLGTGGYNY